MTTFYNTFIHTFTPDDNSKFCKFSKGQGKL